MTSASPDEFKELVRSRSEIAAVVGESIALKPVRGGAEYVGLCPFHPDTNPSLKVYPDRQTFRCWACDTGGDVFSFVMKHDGLEFFDALRTLAERAGLEVPSARGRTGDGPDRVRLAEACSWAAGQCRSFLKSADAADAARRYLSDRGVSPEAAERFGLGFHPVDWEWLLGRARGLYSVPELIAAGVAKERSSGGGVIDWPLFVGRVVFPIRDERGRTVSFGGRKLPGTSEGRDRDDGPKYINGPETALFHKSRVLYGLDLAKDTLRKPDCDTALVTEGYTDCIAAHQAGFANTVATLGTSLTEEHVKVLRRFVRRVVLVLDGDRAGQEAAEKHLQKLLAADVDLRVLSLPEGLDPADFLTKDPGGFARLVGEAPEALDFKLARVAARYGRDSSHAADRTVEEMLGVLSGVPGLGGTPTEANALRRLATRLAIDERVLRRRLDQLRRGGTGGRGPVSFPPENMPSAAPAPVELRFSRDDLAEAELLQIVLVRPDLFPAVNAAVGPDDFRNTRLRTLFEVCRDVDEIEGRLTYADLLSACAGGDQTLLVRLTEGAERKGLAAKLDPSDDDELPTKAAFADADGTASARYPDRTAAREAAAQPPFLRQAVAVIVRRRSDGEARHSRARIARSRVTDGAALDEETRELLRRQQARYAARHAG